MPKTSANRILAIAAISGALLLFIGTYLHPSGADPNATLAAFAEYAADRPWVATHLLQLFGFVFMAGALVLLGRMLAGGPAQALATLGMTGAVAIVAVSAALQAVDGIALKAMVNTWAAAADQEKPSLFYAALAVRQIEIGLASMTSLLAGLTVTLIGIALLMDRRFPKWLGSLAIMGGLPIVPAGVVMAYTGFSALAMTLTLSSSSLMLVWMIGLGVYALRSPMEL